MPNAALNVRVKWAHRSDGIHPLVRGARSFKTSADRIIQAGGHGSNLRKRQVKVIHDPAQVIAFVTFAAVVAGTPGPGNALLTAVGANAGVRRGLPSLLGQVAGMGAMLFAITLGLGNVLLAHPLALEILKWGGAAMLCWMAWRIATSGGAEGATNGPTGFFGMAAFQWVNPKAWLVGVAAIATFLDRRAGGALAQAVIFAILFSLVAFPSCLPWLAFGAALQRFLRTPRARRILNVTMAALLAASTILLVWTGY